MKFRQREAPSASERAKDYWEPLLHPAVQKKTRISGNSISFIASDPRSSLTLLTDQIPLVLA